MDEMNIRMLAREEALLAADPVDSPSSFSPSDIPMAGGHVQAVHTGLRSRDTFHWAHSGSGAVTIKNVFVAFDGVVTGYADGSVNVSGTTYVCATVSFTMEEKKATGVESVTIGSAGAFEDASKKILGDDDELTGVVVPIYKLQKLAGSDVVVCLEDYVHGVPCAVSVQVMDGISLENNADGKPQIMEWDGEENTTGNGISQILKADPESGELSAFGDSGRYELLCRVGGPGGPVGYMPIGEGDGSDPEDPNAAACDQNTHPASGGGGGGEEEEEDSHPADQDEEHPGEGDNGTGGDTGNAQHPAADDCYTTAY